ARRPAGCGRLAHPLSRLYGPRAPSERWPGGGVAAHRPASRRDGRRGGGSLDARLAGRDRRDRRRAIPRAGGRLDRRREAGADRRGPRRDGRRNQASAGWTDHSLATSGVVSGGAQGSTLNAYGAGLAAAVDVFTGGRRGADRSYAEAISHAADAGFVQQRYATMLVAKQGYFDVLRAH